tara:strand:- start:458 stop:883 length:426 start_codon:yes stop_codon:yes gene_type:complete
MKRMQTDGWSNRAVALGCVVVLGLGLFTAPRAAQAQMGTGDARSLEIAEQLIDALGGRANYDGTGMSDDHFWAYVNRETHLMDKFRFQLAVGAEGEFWWRNWERHGPLLLSTPRESAGGATIRMEEIVVTNEMPDDVFTTP